MEQSGSWFKPLVQYCEQEPARVSYIISGILSKNPNFGKKLIGLSSERMQSTTESMLSSSELIFFLNGHLLSEVNIEGSSAFLFAN